MKRIGLFEAKTNLSKIVEEVKRTGKSVTLTRRGEPYVDLVPHQPTKSQRPTREQVFEEIENLRRHLPRATLKEIKADISEGRL